MATLLLVVEAEYREQEWSVRLEEADVRAMYQSVFPIIL